MRLKAVDVRLKAVDVRLRAVDGEFIAAFSLSGDRVPAFACGWLGVVNLAVRAHGQLMAGKGRTPVKAISLQSERMRGAGRGVK